MMLLGLLIVATVMAYTSIIFRLPKPKDKPIPKGKVLPFKKPVKSVKW